MSLNMTPLGPSRIANMVGCSPETVPKVVKKFEATGSMEDRPRSGRPPKFDSRDHRQLHSEGHKNRWLPLPYVRFYSPEIIPQDRYEEAKTPSEASAQYKAQGRSLSAC